MSDEPLNDLVKWFGEWKPRNVFALMAVSLFRFTVRRVAHIFQRINARYG